MIRKMMTFAAMERERIMHERLFNWNCASAIFDSYAVRMDWICGFWVRILCNNISRHSNSTADYRWNDCTGISNWMRYLCSSQDSEESS